MTEKIKTKGECTQCKESVSKQMAKRHLEKCFFGVSQNTQERCFLVKVADNSSTPIFWLYLAVPFHSTLSNLDSYLRDIWLECCGHCSVFKIGDVDYMSHYEGLRGEFRYREQKSMDTKAVRVFSNGLTFTHEYDFGTTTELVLEVIGNYHRDLQREITLLMRNEKPVFSCSKCKVEATIICPYCQDILCIKCGSNHECLESAEDFLPFVNSPRTGCCAYTGD